jgi:hypothetical protein
MVSASSGSSHFWQVPAYIGWTQVSVLSEILELLSSEYVLLSITQSVLSQSLDKIVYKLLDFDYLQESTSYMHNFLQASINEFNFVRLFSASLSNRAS